MFAKLLIVAMFFLGAYASELLTPAMVKKCRIIIDRAQARLDSCYDNLADWETLTQDIAEAVRLHSSFDEVFRKYCSRKAQYFGCFMELVDSYKPCYDVSGRARKLNDIEMDIIDDLLQFICQEDGDVNISFVKAHGLECLKQPSRGKVIKECFDGLDSIHPENIGNPTFSTFITIYNHSTCGILYKFQKCVVQELNTCSQEVGNTAQSLIRSVLLRTPCQHVPGAESEENAGDVEQLEKPIHSKPNSASGLTVTMLSSVVAASCVLLM